MSRKTAREHSFRILFSSIFQHEKVDHLISSYFDNTEIGWPEDEKDLEFVRKIVLGVIQREKEIDAMIEAALLSWKLNRLSKVDLTLLRLSAYEIAYAEDVPVQVSINEAVELAKKYSMDTSPSFINGVLGAIAVKFTGSKEEDNLKDQPAAEEQLSSSEAEDNVQAPEQVKVQPETGAQAENEVQSETVTTDDENGKAGI